MQGATACFRNLFGTSSSACYSFLFPIELFACVAAGYRALLQRALSFSSAPAVLEGMSMGVSGFSCLLSGYPAIALSEPWCLLDMQALSSLLFYKP